MDRDEDTLSLASLVQPNVPIKPQAGRPKQLPAGPSFEFRQASTPTSSSPADLLFTNDTVSARSPFPVDEKRIKQYAAVPEAGERAEVSGFSTEEGLFSRTRGYTKVFSFQSTA